jgi:hypothetical protein
MPIPPMSFFGKIKDSVIPKPYLPKPLANGVRAIKIAVKNKEVNLTVEEAKELCRSLETVFNSVYPCSH